MEKLIKLISHNYFWTGITVIVSIITTVKNYKLSKNMQKEKLIVEERIEYFKSDSAKNLQIDNYFRNINGKELESVFNFWLNSLTDIEEFTKSVKDTKKLNTMLKHTIVCGSTKTIKILAHLQQHNFKNVSDNELEKISSSFKTLIYAVLIVSSLKEDFTGQKINPLNLLKIKLNDYDKNEIILKKYYDEILEELEQI